MKEKIIYSNNINETEFLKSSALKGVNTFNTRIINFQSLLEEVNSRLGHPVLDNLLNKDEIEKTVLGFFSDKVHLNNVSYQDITHFMSTFNNIRYYIIDSDEQKEINSVIPKHPELNNLKEFSDSYFESLNNNIDMFIFAHRLVAMCGKNGKPFDAIYYLNEFKLTPLEESVLHSIANKVIPTTVTELITSTGNKTNIRKIEPRYGVRNEVAHVVKDILDNKYKQDECQIVLVNKSRYTNELYMQMLKCGLQMTFESGLPINLSDAFKLYQSCKALGDRYFYDVNGYLNLFSSNSIDLEKMGVKHPVQVAQILGRMKICFDEKVNNEYIAQYNELKNENNEEFLLFLEKIDRVIYFERKEILPEIENVMKVMSKGISNFIKEYTKINIKDVEFSQSAIDYISNEIDYANSLPESLRESYLKIIANKYLKCQVFNDQAIHVADLNKALSTTRPHIYIIGLNSSFYPGSITEDFLFSDELYYELSGHKNITPETLNFKNEYLRKVINTYLELGCDVYLSFNSQEMKEVRPLNACSVLLDFAEEFYKDENEKRRKEKNETKKYIDVLTEKVTECSYYDDELSDLSSVSKTGIDNKDIKFEPHTIKQIFNNGTNYRGEDLLDVSYSPSSLPVFSGCPFRFYLNVIVGADNTITYDNLRPMSGNRFGDLLHYVMEKYVNNPTMDEKQVVNYADLLYSLYIKLDRSVSDDNLEREEFKKNVTNAFKFLQNLDLKDNKTELDVGKKAEKEKSNIGGLFFKGNIDLVTKDKSGNYIIVDYKTGKNIEHVENDVSSCIQGLIYSQLYELIHGVKITKLIFYYTRYDKAITFANPCSEEAKEALIEQIKKMREAIVKHEYPLADPSTYEDVCKYCKYENICKKPEPTKGA